MSDEAQDQLHSDGMKIRRKVMSDAHVDRSLSTATPFSKPIQDLATSSAWGTLWSRPGLSLRDRSLITISFLTALNRNTELAGHVKGALRNGVTEEEIRECFVHASGYCGFPAAMESTRVAQKVIDDMKESGEL